MSLIPRARAVVPPTFAPSLLVLIEPNLLPVGAIKHKLFPAKVPSIVDAPLASHADGSALASIFLAVKASSRPNFRLLKTPALGLLAAPGDVRMRGQPALYW